MAIGRLDLNLLYVFDAVMAERNVTRASRLLNMTQPAVSNAISRLRQVLKDDLFVKTPVGITPTPRAESIWPVVTEALARIRQTVDPQEFAPRHARAVLRIGMSDYVAHQIARPLFAELEREAPQLSLHLRPHSVDKVVSLLEQGYLDIAAGVLETDAPNIHALPLEPVEYVCVMKSDHVLARGRLTMEKFLSARHLAVSLEGGRSVIDRQLEKQGVRRDLGLIVNNFSIVPRILVETQLIGIFPLKTILNSSYRDELAIVKAPVQVPPGTISLLWHARSHNLPLYQWLRRKIVEVSQVQNGGAKSGGAPAQ